MTLSEKIRIKERAIRDRMTKTMFDGRFPWKEHDDKENKEKIVRRMLGTKEKGG